MESSELPPRRTHGTRDTQSSLSPTDLASAGFIGNSQGLRTAVALLKQFSTTALPLLILGETGTGKDVAARAIHRWSGRRGAFVDVNCGALPEHLVEGELFGHARGAFTGARETRPGLVEAARGGTLFLDEVGSLTQAAQAKLLRVLEAGEVRRLGDTRNRKVDFRLVAAGHAHLLDDRRMTFREDLLHRMGGIVVTLPPLREREEDAELIAEHYARLNDATLDPGCRTVLRNNAWRGNIRELLGAINRASLLAPDRVITERVLVSALGLGATSRVLASPPPDSAWARRDAYLRACLARRWCVGEIARDSGAHRSTVYRWLKNHRLQVPRPA